jgi:hypothetical protein
LTNLIFSIHVAFRNIANLYYTGNASLSAELFAVSKWSSAQAPVMEISGVIKALQLTTYRNLATQPVVTHVQGLQR